MKRMLVAVTVPDDWDVDALADHTAAAVAGMSRLGWADVDATAWEWPDFWADAADGVVSEVSDGTVTL